MATDSRQVVASPPGTGIYTLSGNCTGTLMFHPTGPSSNSVASPKGDELWMIQTNPNNVLQGSVKRISK